MENNNKLGVSFSLCFLGTVFYCYIYYLRIIPSVLRPELKLMHNIGEAGFGFLVSLYYWAYLPLQIPAGLLMDIFGVKKILTTACIVCAIGTCLFINNNLLIVQIGRFLVGCGSAFAYVGVLKLSNEWLPKKMFAFMVGLCASLGMLGAIIGQIFITKYILVFSWQGLILISALFGAFLSIILWCFIKNRDPIVKGLALHIISNKLQKELIELVKSPGLWLIGLISSLMLVILTVFVDTWAVSFLVVKGINESNAVISSSMVYLGFSVGAPLWGILSILIFNRKTVVIVGCIVTAILISIILYVEINIQWMNVYMFLLGLFASTECLVFALTNHLASKEIIGTAFGLVNAIACLSGILLQPIVGLIIDYLVVKYDFLEIINFKLALMVLPIALVLSGFLSMFLKNGVLCYK